MILKIFEDLLYKIGAIASFIGVFLFMVDFGFNSTNMLIKIIAMITMYLSFILILSMLVDILILYPIYYIKRRKKYELNNKEKAALKYRHKINITLNSYCIIMYIVTFIINSITFNELVINSFYGIILGLTIVRKHKKNIMEIEEKIYINKIYTLKNLTNLCIVANIFIIIDLFLDKVIKANFYNENKEFIISISFVIVILIAIILNLIKNKKNKQEEKEEKEEKFKKGIIILKILLLMFFCVTYPQSIPCMLIIFELLKELNKYIKTKIDKIIFILFSVFSLIYTLVPIILMFKM